MSYSEDITRSANSNLAYAFKILPKKKRQDIQTFYAFCRIMDDLADAGDAPTEKRAEALNEWKDGLVHGFSNPDPLQKEVIALRQRTEIPNRHLVDLIDGCLMDLEVRRYQSWEDLETYIWKVACTVGLVSTRLFGCQSPESQQYAIFLAKALQLTNIMRDLKEDLDERDRIYLPLQDLHQFGYSEEELAKHTYNQAFLDLMNFQAVRAENLFEEAQLSLTSFDHKALRPARIMNDIYRDLLTQMRQDQFRVFETRYSVSPRRKTCIFIKNLFA